MRIGRGRSAVCGETLGVAPSVLNVAVAWCREPGKKYDVEVWGTRSCCHERELQTP